MKRLRLIRKAFGYPLDYIAEQVQRPIATVKAWEVGIDVPSLTELRDLALFYETGVDQLAGDDTLGHRPMRTCRLAVDDGLDGFWGHLGVMLPGARSYRWYPVTASTAAEIEAGVNRRAHPEFLSRSLLVETLNNRLLWLNLARVKSVCLCDDEGEWPEPGVEPQQEPSGGLAALEGHPTHLIPLVMYEALTERVRGAEWVGRVSDHLRQEVDRLLDARRDEISDDQVRRLLLRARLWMADSSVLWISASGESMEEAMVDLADGATGELLRLSNNDGGHLRFAFPLDRVAAVDLPVSALRCHEVPD